MDKIGKARLVYGVTPMTKFSRFVNDELGATAIEYALIAAIVSMSIIVALQGFRTSLQSTFNSVQSNLSAANSK